MQLKLLLVIVYDILLYHAQTPGEFLNLLCLLIEVFCTSIEIFLTCCLNHPFLWHITSVLQDFTFSHLCSSHDAQKDSSA